ncbi:acyl-CoA dehydrogenase family protein [Streptomyces sp. NBC_01808]|uniref:acyl-CoA dehydrogenase family protein n=1 Tax=Streptomyces sp. NBC_01808 TaxID=2975947 RepID=UPI002DDAFF40|nr:acyl-CoA dehydrogenase family protein [Streptomyces sp. NBC_01808]WSA36294.1 acyl-CoA dehydrogenase family protein [Streptomyces sp. NBC_01808]
MTAALRAEVRAFLAAQPFTPAVDAWHGGWDQEFTRALAERGWVGMTIPRTYGGPGRTYPERYAVTEELLAAGAPVAAHWIADRQVAPALLAYGSEEQKRDFLPRIAAGGCSFAIGMSEPDAGSDLASVRTRGEPADGGWRLTGTKVWTTGAHLADAFVVLARTSPPDPDDRHAGLSQFVVDLRAPGVAVRPIVSMGGDHHFNEVTLTDVFVPDARVLGRIGDGWRQVTAELGYERSGPERFLSTLPLLADTAAAMGRGELPGHPGLGRQVARVAALRHLSHGVAAALQAGEPAETEAALVKLLGTTLEGDIVELADQLGVTTPLLTTGLLRRPGFTLRGGSSEILRGVIARDLEVRR